MDTERYAAIIGLAQYCLNIYLTLKAYDISFILLCQFMHS